MNIYCKIIKKIEAFWESENDEIDSKVEDIDRYISNVNKTLNTVSKNRPAQALIQLQSCSDTEDLQNCLSRY